jgi:hypothetical protein
MSKYAVQRPRHAVEIQCVDEEGRELDLPASMRPEEAPQLLLLSPSSPGGLLLKGPERFKVTLRVDDLFHRGGPQGPDQLVLEVCDAHVEAELFHLGASEVRAEPGPLETAPEVALFSGVTESRQSEVQPLRAEPVQEASDCLRTADWHNRNAFTSKIPATALSERLERGLVAEPFDKYDRTCERGIRRQLAAETSRTAFTMPS